MGMNVFWVLSVAVVCFMGWGNFVAITSYPPKPYTLNHPFQYQMERFRKESRALDALMEGIDLGDAVKAEEADPKIQLCGHLYKKATSGANLWSRRFFVLKDGVLYYYSPRSADTFPLFDFHPKGVLPLDACKVSRVDDGPPRRERHSLAIHHPSFGLRALVLCADTEAVIEQWLAAIENSRFITYPNAISGSSQLKKLREQNIKLQTRLTTALREVRNREKALAKEKSMVSALQTVAAKYLLQNQALQKLLDDHGIESSLPPITDEHLVSTVEQLSTQIKLPEDKDEASEPIKSEEEEEQRPRKMSSLAERVAAMKS